MTDFPTGEMIQIEPLVARVLAPNPSPYTYSGTQTHLVGTSDLAVIDPGPDDPAHVEALIRAIDGRPVTAIVITHTHRDHSPASRPLAALTGAPIVGCAALALDDLGPRADASFDRDYVPDRVLADGESVSGDGWTLTAIATPGHTSNHLAFALPETKALFSGDHVMGWSTTVVSPPDGDMAAYMASLARLMDRDDRVYYPAHGEQIDKPRRFVRGLIGHRKQREGQILRLLDAQVGTLPGMVERMYVGIDPRLSVAAERSVLAHLIDLRARGLVSEEAGEWTKKLTRLIGPAVGIVVIVAVVAALIVGYHSYTQRYRVSTGPGDDVAVSQVVRATFAGASDLKVAALSGSVQSVSASKSLGMFDANRVMKAPFTVEYFVDLSRMGPSDFLWTPATRTLTVHPPDVRVGAANVDEAKTTLDRTQGLIVTRGAMAELQRIASANAQRVAGEAALKPDRLAAARRNARDDLARLLGGPLRAAGLGHVKVQVVFPGEGPRSASQWDVTRSIPEVLADHAE